MKTGFIGLGAMGQGMVRQLVKSGLLTTVYNRTADKAKRLAAELHIIHSPSVELLTKQVKVILLCISADEDLLQLLDTLQLFITPGTIVVDMSTVSSHTACKAASLLAKKQVDFLDAPVSGGVEGANQGTLSMMVGGKREVLETVRPILAAMTDHILYMGDTGSGQATKAVNQIMVAGINQAVSEALTFGQIQGLAMEKVIEVISSGAAGNWFLQHRGLTMTQGVFTPGFKVALHDKDLRICQQMAEELDLPLPLTEMTRGDYQQLMNEGFGDEDISALYRLKRKA